MEREKMPLYGKLRLLLLFNPLAEWFDTTRPWRVALHLMSIKKGKARRCRDAEAGVELTLGTRQGRGDG